MASFKAVILRDRQKKDGSYQVKIRLTHNRKTIYIGTPWSVDKTQLTRSYEIRDRFTLNESGRLIDRYQQAAARLGMEIKTMTAAEVLDYVERDVKLREAAAAKVANDVLFTLDVADYTKNIAHKLKANGRTGTALTYAFLESCIRQKAPAGLDINQVRAPWINDFMQWYMNGRNVEGRVNKASSAGMLFDRLRTVYHRAQVEFNDEENGVIRIPGDPFKRASRPIVTGITMRAISLEDMRSVIEYKPLKKYKVRISADELAHDIFCLSFLLVGMNAADLYTASAAQDGRITYKRKKTRAHRKDEALISIAIPPEAEPLLKKYADPDSKCLTNLYRRYKSLHMLNIALADGMRKIKDALGIDNLVFYSARHTWATLARNEVGIDKYTVHTALNHVDQFTKITDVYIKPDWRPIDEANRKVIDYVGFEDLDV